MGGVVIEGPCHVRETSASEEASWLNDRLERPEAALEVQITRYHEPELILGRSQAQRWPLARLAQQSGMPVVVRASGGGVVLAGPWLVSIAVVASIDHSLARCGVADAYRWLGMLHERVMRRCGLAARARAPETLPPRRAEDPVHWVCFSSLSPWEVTDQDRKLCGLAQARSQRAIALVAGTHVVRPPWERLAQAFDCDDVGRIMDDRAVDMASLGGGVTARDLCGLLVDELRRDAAWTKENQNGNA